MADTATLQRPAPTAQSAVIVRAIPVPLIKPARLLPFQSSEVRIAGQPKWLRLYRTARPALNAALWNRASICLVHFESNCLQYNLPPQKGESDEAKFARWCLGFDRAIDRPVLESSQLGGISPVFRAHDDGTRDVLEVLRINSATPTTNPALSDGYFFDRPRLLVDIVTGRTDLLCQADGWGMFAQSKIIHGGPALAMPDGTPLEGDHLPAPGRVALGRNRVHRKPGAEMLADDVG